MNVFVLCTGRCGSTTFAAACKSMTNYTVVHEMQSQERPVGHRYQSLEYPQRHIEVDNRLSWFLGALDEDYGKNAFYVHLLRDREEVARSFLQRWDQRGTNIIFSFAWGPLTMPYGRAAGLPEADRLAVARQYWDTVNGNIRMFLRDKPHAMTMWLNNIKQPFAEFWQEIGAEGDLDEALRMWDTRRNASIVQPAPSTVTRSTTASPATRDHSPANALGTATKVAVRTPAEEMRDETHAKGSTAVAATQQAIAKALELRCHTGLAQLACLPEPTSWTVDRETLAFLVRLIEQLAPRNILELGSGLSTCVMLEASAHLPIPCRLTSIEHDPQYAAATVGSIPSSMIDRLHVQVAPLVLRKLGDSSVPSYHLEWSEIPTAEPFDLCLIDGPPKQLGGREGTLYQILDHCREGTCILLDDADREHEREIMKRWTATLGRAIHVTRLEGFEKGLAAIVVQQPLSPVRLWDQKLQSAAKDLHEVIPEGARVLIVDDYQWPHELTEAMQFQLERDSLVPPIDSQEGIRKIQERRAQGIEFLVFAWPAYWWFNHYRELAEHLMASGACVFSNERVVVYDLRRAATNGISALHVASEDRSA